MRKVESMRMNLLTSNISQATLNTTTLNAIAATSVFWWQIFIAWFGWWKVVGFWNIVSDGIVIISWFYKVIS